jgi:single-stranded-DNA-specific exonuclease
VFLPSRFRHGYGLDAGVVGQALEQAYRVLISVDCGTSNVEEIAQAHAGGMEVAVIDHHALQETVPDAPMLNPHLEQGMPPLCTAALVYYALRDLQDAAPPAWFGDETELAGAAVIADVVPLVPENWWLAHQALSLLPETVNTGMAELVKASGLHGLTRLTGQQIAFQIVPRLNAAGRMQSARVVLDLLSAQEPQTARLLARQLDQLNVSRKAEADSVFRSALLQATRQGERQAIVLYDPSWHVGVLGIVAARVAEQMGKPAMVLADDPAGSGLLAGSVRTAGGVSAIESLGEVRDALFSFGGHAQAAGVRLTRDNLARFADEWAKAVGSARAPDAEAELPPGVQLGELTAGFEDDVWSLAPFGAGFPPPRAVIEGCRVSRTKLIGRDRTHLHLWMTDGEREVRLTAFNMSHLHSRLRIGQQVRPVVEIDTDNWNNRCGIVLRVVAIA